LGIAIGQNVESLEFQIFGDGFPQVFLVVNDRNRRLHAFCPCLFADNDDIALGCTLG